MAELQAGLRARSIMGAVECAAEWMSQGAFGGGSLSISIQSHLTSDSSPRPLASGDPVRPTAAAG